MPRILDSAAVRGSAADPTTHDGERYYAGHWEGNRGRVEHDRHSDHDRDRDYHDRHDDHHEDHDRHYSILDCFPTAYPRFVDVRLPEPDCSELG